MSGARRLGAPARGLRSALLGLVAACAGAPAEGDPVPLEPAPARAEAGTLEAGDDERLASLRDQLEAQRRARAAGAAAESGTPPPELQDALARQLEEQISARSTARPGGSAIDREALSREIESDARLREQLSEGWRLSARGVGELRFCVDRRERVSELPGDLVLWRPLERADFQGPAPASIEAGSGVKVAAFVALALFCETELRVRRLASGEVEVTLASLDYFPVLSREASWWSPRSEFPDEWILRHEQIHFDLAELEARRLQAASATTRAALRAVDRDGDAALARLAERWNEHIEQANHRLDEREARFDRESLHGNDPDAQTRWWDDTRRELRAVAYRSTAP